MEPLPRKQTLPELVLARLREGISAGEWKGILPAERVLSETLQVSRQTLRLAIAQLRNEGWLDVVGKRTVIQRRRSRPRAEVMSTRRIIFLSPHALERLSSVGLFVYGELSRKLSPLGATIQIETSPAFSHRKVKGYLDKLVVKSRADAWVLHRSPPEVQRYFQALGTPTVLLGNAHKSISIPALNIDYAAALKHCMNRLDGLGHSTDRIVLVVPETRLAGNIEIEAAFRAATGTCILRYDEQSENASELLTRALSRARKPTAFVVLRTSIATKIHGLLQHRHSLSLPRDISLACLEDAAFMEHLVPQITRYHIDSSKIAQLIFTTLSRQLSSGIIKNWSHRPLIPKLIPGDTVGEAREGD
jgi:DNA-binding LacI/PurR family transcriptional regulator